jgi:hypothetical protein
MKRDGATTAMPPSTKSPSTRPPATPPTAKRALPAAAGIVLATIALAGLMGAIAVPGPAAAQEWRRPVAAGWRFGFRGDGGGFGMRFGRRFDDDDRPVFRRREDEDGWRGDGGWRGDDGWRRPRARFYLPPPMIVTPVAPPVVVYGAPAPPVENVYVPSPPPDTMTANGTTDAMSSAAGPAPPASALPSGISLAQLP